MMQFLAVVVLVADGIANLIDPSIRMGGTARVILKTLEATGRGKLALEVPGGFADF